MRSTARSSCGYTQSVFECDRSALPAVVKWLPTTAKRSQPDEHTHHVLSERKFCAVVVGPLARISYVIFFIHHVFFLSLREEYLDLRRSACDPHYAEPGALRAAAAGSHLSICYTSNLLSSRVPYSSPSLPRARHARE